MTDWSTLEDAMGTAEAVLELIAALEAPRKRERFDAFEELPHELRVALDLFPGGLVLDLREIVGRPRRRGWRG